MKISIEPTEEKFNCKVNGADVPMRVWRGVTDGGATCDLYIFSVVPDRGQEARFASERPLFMVPTRTVAAVGDHPQEKPQ